ncbi:MAG TPA: hypothetical protein VHV76_14165 [Mycobacteriales bacterium]|jgi:hypothetical protein|nr:hypothetical protein [Mycobacteriales bacterium]
MEESLVPLKSGQRLRSQVCTTEVIVVRVPADDLELSCGGTPMVELGTEITEGGAPAAGLDEGTLLGKRYTTDDADGALELLVTKGGDGTLAGNGVPLVTKESKPLPSSD